ncbi:MAG TPA: peptidase M48, partial [Gammaproteobacteria bacterium]|nr:peptidase M48 [Gammaproteobacteria bacterium]
MIVVWLTSLTLPSFAAPLPDLGDASSAIVSPDQEYRLGRAWLRQLRAQVPLIHDPLIYDYLYNLVYRLASASDIERPDIALVVINNAAINAFAVPGGVMGLNGGLLLNARTEDEVGGVIAHELAHLSQRHFARGVERSQQNSWAGLAALLASIAIAATAGGEAGMAALATTQA